MIIYKYTIEVAYFQVVDMPKNSKILSAQVQHGQVRLWALCDPALPIQERRVFMFGTGRTFNGLAPGVFAIIHPVILALFEVDTEFKSQDFRQMNSALEALKTFELVSDQILSQASKRDILARMFDVDPEEEEQNLEEEAAARGSDTSLNGAQVTAMSQFLAQLATGQLAPDTAIQALMVSFNLSREDAEAIVEPMNGFKPKVVTK